MCIHTEGAAARAGHHTVPCRGLAGGAHHRTRDTSHFQRHGGAGGAGQQSPAEGGERARICVYLGTKVQDEQHAKRKAPLSVGVGFDVRSKAPSPPFASFGSRCLIRWG